jgi:hypothetical protein
MVIWQRQMFGFVDLEEAYDSFNRQWLWTVLPRKNVSKGLKEIIKNIYDNLKTVW